MPSHFTRDSGFPAAITASLHTPCHDHLTKKSIAAKRHDLMKMLGEILLWTGQIALLIWGIFYVFKRRIEVSVFCPFCHALQKITYCLKDQMAVGETYNMEMLCANCGKKSQLKKTNIAAIGSDPQYRAEKE